MGQGSGEKIRVKEACADPELNERVFKKPGELGISGLDVLL